MKLVTTSTLIDSIELKHIQFITILVIKYNTPNETISVSSIFLNYLIPGISADI